MVVNWTQGEGLSLDLILLVCRIKKFNCLISPHQFYSRNVKIIQLCFPIIHVSHLLSVSPSRYEFVQGDAACRPYILYTDFYFLKWIHNRVHFEPLVNLLKLLTSRFNRWYLGTCSLYILKIFVFFFVLFISVVI